MDQRERKTRREFLQNTGLTAGASIALASGMPAIAADEPAAALTVTTGDDPKALVKKAVAELGGMNRFVAKGDVVVIKPNIGWEKTPQWAANTNPDVVAGLIEMALDAGAKEVKVFDRTVRNRNKCYATSGIETAAKEAGAKVLHTAGMEIAEIPIPEGKFLKKQKVYKDALECDCFINVPVAKHHVLTRVTLCMKGHMGIIADSSRRVWHPSLDQAIADFSSAFEPKLSVLDAWRVVLNGGPNTRSLKDVKLAKTCIAGTNQVTVDAYGTTLFDLKVEQVGHIRVAGQMGVGETDLSKIKVREATA